MAPNVTILDLDAVVPERNVVVKLDGKDHPLVPITLENYLLNTKLIRDLVAGEGDLDAESAIALDMVDRAFPSIGRDRLNKLTLEQINKLSEFARGGDGSAAVKENEQKEAAENPQ